MYERNGIMDKLYIVIPCYNESETIEEVATSWHKIVEKTNKDSRLVILNDGSKDNSLEILHKLQEKLPQLDVVDKKNSGHGATVLYGYKYALENGADYIFQTDSDGQTKPEEFIPFWKHRKKYDVIIGHRNKRQDGLSRVFVTKVLKLVLLLSFGVNVKDANTPFRLMKREVLEKYIQKVPKDFNLSNVLLSVMFVKYKENVKFVPITFKPRQGGVNSINLKKIFKIGLKAVKDFRTIKKTL
jgi:glycosyltransferase involved in cell wall biosynthesis